jgi:tol-pal system protein YbgF
MTHFQEERVNVTRKQFLLPLVLLLTACASRGDLDYVQRDLDELKNRLSMAEKGMTSAKAESRELAEKSSREALTEVSALRRSSADLQANLDSMRVDLQSMAGRVDDLGLAAKKPADELVLLREDVIRRFTAMEDRQVRLEKGLDDARNKMAALAKALETPPTPEGIYQQGLELLKKNETKKAREVFSKFLEMNPAHALAANARYWLGETWYAEKNYEQAILEYQQIIKEFPGKDKVPAAMLKQAMGFRELKDGKSAKFILQDLLEKFPASEESGKAKELLATMK